MFSFGTRMLVKRILPVAVPRMPHFSARALDHLEARHVGRDEEGRHLRAFAFAASGVRAITVSTSAMPPLVM